MSTDIIKRIDTLYPTFSKGQKKLANAVLTEYEKVGYMTATRLGQHVGVSESTVVRFANELGFEGYGEFQDAVQELARMYLTPNERIDLTKCRIGNHSDIVEKVMESDMNKVRRTMERVNRTQFRRAVDTIIKARKIYIMGARSSEPLARFLQYNLSLIFDNVRLVLPMSTSEVFEQMLDVGAEDVLIAFSFPRYSTKMINAVKYAHDCSVKTIVFTDSDVSPLAAVGDFVLTAESDMASFMDSLVAPISLINAMVVELTSRCEHRIKDRFEKLERMWDNYGVYTKSPKDRLKEEAKKAEKPTGK